jgi:hypothetical protein
MEHFSTVPRGQSKYRTSSVDTLNSGVRSQHSNNIQTKYNIPEESFGFDQHSGGIPLPSQTPCDCLCPLENSILSATVPAVVPSLMSKLPDKINTIFSPMLLCYNHIQESTYTIWCSDCVFSVCISRLDFHYSS